MLLARNTVSMYLAESNHLVILFQIDFINFEYLDLHA
jgi:hypothetical protein